MKLQDFPQPGNFSGANQLFQSAFKALSFLQIGAVHNKGKNSEAKALKEFFLKCADLADEMVIEEEVQETKKRGK